MPTDAEVGAIVLESIEMMAQAASRCGFNAMRWDHEAPQLWVLRDGCGGKLGHVSYDLERGLVGVTPVQVDVSAMYWALKQQRQLESTL